VNVAASLPPTWAEPMTACSTFVLAVVGVVAAFIALRSLRETRVDAMADHQRRRAEARVKVLREMEDTATTAWSSVLMLRNGRFDIRPAQPSAYEHLEELCESIDAKIALEARSAKAPPAVTELKSGGGFRGRIAPR
jgi:hypothetical protein